jgi:hypothetical protein
MSYPITSILPASPLSTGDSVTLILYLILLNALGFHNNNDNNNNNLHGIY